MSSRYDPSNWYWVVAASTTQVFKSKTCAYVSVNDSDYVAWLAAGNAPTAIASASLLSLVLQAQLVPMLLSTGIVITSTGDGALNATYALDAVSTGNIRDIAVPSAAGLGLPGSTLGGGTTVSYPDITGTQHTFTATQIQNLFKAVRDYQFSLQGALAEIVLTGSGSLPPNTATIP